MVIFGVRVMVIGFGCLWVTCIFIIVVGSGVYFDFEGEGIWTFDCD